MDMIIKPPEISHVPHLRVLFAEAFSEGEAFLDDFFDIGFSPERSLAALEQDKLIGALYWFDCEQDGAKVAYVFGVAVIQDCRGAGVGSALLLETEKHLRKLGYASIILVPASERLFDYYSALGYKEASGLSELHINTSGTPAELTRIGLSRYAELRRAMLPCGGVIEEGAILEMLASGAEFYTGSDFLLARLRTEEQLFVIELLGNTDRASDITATFGHKSGVFRTAGSERKFTMYLPLRDDAVPPTYFGIALDV